MKLTAAMLRTAGEAARAYPRRHGWHWGRLGGMWANETDIHNLTAAIHRGDEMALG